jgi:hypothetical protein
MSTKHPVSVYTVMMILSAIFMALACIFMLFEFNRYEGVPRQPAGGVAAPPS